MDPIIGNWIKTVPLVGTMHCNFKSDGTGIAQGKILGHNINELFWWTPLGNGLYHIRAHGYEHDIQLSEDKLKTVFRGYNLDMSRVKSKGE